MKRVVDVDHELHVCEAYVNLRAMHLTPDYLPPIVMTYSSLIKSEGKEL